MSDDSKAIEEIAKTTGKAIDAGREVGGFLSKYAGATLAQAFGIFEDKLKYIRFERQLRLIDRTNELLAQRALQGPTRSVPLQIIIPLFQGASLEEDNYMQDRWAALLANAADNDSGLEIRRAFISILEDLTAMDAELLDKIYSPSFVIDEDPPMWTTNAPSMVTEQAPDEYSIQPPPQLDVALGNLARLGLVRTTRAYGGYENDVRLSHITHTALGAEFMRATQKGKESRVQ